jgi:hypothetical protein
MRTDEAYVRSLEKRIKNQRAQLRWWQDSFKQKHIRRKDVSTWTAFRVCALLRRLGSHHRVDEGGGVYRRATARKAA